MKAGLDSRGRRNWGRFTTCIAIGVASAFQGALATEVEYVGSMGSRAVLQVNGGAPRTVSVGASTPEGVRLVALEGDRVLVEIDGQRSQVRLGERVIRSARPSDVASVVLHADARGHFTSEGSINGAPVRFLVDTGASLVSLGKGDAQRAGIDFQRGVPAATLTAAGPMQVWQVKLDSLRIGSMTLHNVDAVVLAQDLPIVLLGMSVLNRVEMRREGQVLRLQQRY